MENPRELVCDRATARVFVAALGFRQADINKELPVAVNGTLPKTKRGLLNLHGVTEFEHTRAGGTVE